MISPTPGTRPYKGSCHCGATKYILFLNLPHAPDPTNPGPRQFFARCNCTFCHKLALLHIRVPSPSDDFLLISPSDPFTELGDYISSKNNVHWFFCKTCGGRCFTFLGVGEHEEVDLGTLGVAGERTGKTTKVWKVKKEEPPVAGIRYLSINANSVDAGQDGFDLREWMEKGWLKYVENLNVHGDARPQLGDKPFAGGVY